MAYDTYSDLVSSVADYLKEDDLTSQIGDFILLFEAVARARFKHPDNEVRTSFTVDAQYKTIPSAAHSVKSIELDVATGNAWVDQASNQHISEKFGRQQTGQPEMFAVIGSEIRFGPVPDGSYTSEIIYWKKLPALVNEINWLYTSFPMIYVYGTLLQAEPWLQNDERLVTWQGMYNGAIAALNSDGAAKEFGSTIRATAKVRKV